MHPTDYVTHHREIAELQTGDGAAVEVEITQHEQPIRGFLGAPAVRVALVAPDSDIVTDLHPAVAASIGRIILDLDDRQRRAFGLALVDGAALVLGGTA